MFALVHRACTLAPALLVVLGFATDLLAEPPAQTPTKLVFETAEGTNLAEALHARRATLEARTGGPLKGHAWWLWGLGAFDYDLDGDLDLVVCVHGPRHGMILKNLLVESGKLTFVDVTKELGVDGQIPSTDNYPLLWDLNGDGLVDIAGLFDDSPTSCLINQRGQGFELAEFSLHPINYPTQIRDLNADGFVDISQVRRGEQVLALFDPKEKKFSISKESYTRPQVLPDDVLQELAELKLDPKNRFVKDSVLEPGDLDGDGRPDLLVSVFGSYGGARLGWYLAGGPEGSYFDRGRQFGLPHAGTPFLTRDLDADGDIDILTTSADDAGLYLNDGQGRFTRRDGALSEFLVRRCPYLHHVELADLDHDGDLDLAISNRRYGAERIFENQGEGNFQVVLKQRGWDADPFVLADIDNDGRLDAVIGGAGEKENIGIFLNRTPDVGNACWLYPRMPLPNRYAVGTQIQAYVAGTMNTDSPVLLVDTLAPTAGLPILIGLGQANTVDLRLKFPGHEPVELTSLPIKPRMQVGPDGEVSRFQGDLLLK